MVVPCIIAGCRHHETKLSETPPNFREPPHAIVCMECSNRCDAVYRRDDYYFSICFLNCCRISKGTPYLSCSTCHASFGEFGTNVCERCRTASPSQFIYCPHCGKKSD